MENEHVHVRNVSGRYPSHPRRLDSDNIEATVTIESQIVRVRIDDADNPDAWIEVILEIPS